MSSRTQNRRHQLRYWRYAAHYAGPDLVFGSRKAGWGWLKGANWGNAERRRRLKLLINQDGKNAPRRARL